MEDTRHSDAFTETITLSVITMLTSIMLLAVPFLPHIPQLNEGKLLFSWSEGFTYTPFTDSIPAPAETVTMEPTATDPKFVRDVLDSVDAQHVQFIITDDPYWNCSMELIEESDIPLAGGGCFHHATPDTIYVSTQLASNDETRALILHEYAHVIQFDANMKFKSLELKECDADRIAQNLGAASDSLYYTLMGRCS